MFCTLNFIDYVYLIDLHICTIPYTLVMHFVHNALYLVPFLANPCLVTFSLYHVPGAYPVQVDVGEEKSRTVISGLVKFIPEPEMQDRMAIILCNLKPSKMRGIMSEV